MVEVSQGTLWITIHVNTCMTTLNTGSTIYLKTSLGAVDTPWKEVIYDIRGTLATLVGY